MQLALELKSRASCKVLERRERKKKKKRKSIFIGKVTKPPVHLSISFVIGCSKTYNFFQLFQQFNVMFGRVVYKFLLWPFIPDLNSCLALMPLAHKPHLVRVSIRVVVCARREFNLWNNLCYSTMFFFIE